MEGIATASEADHRAAFSALRWTVGRWILQPREVVFVGPVVHVDFRLKLTATAWAVLPVSGMAFGMMETAEREATVIPGAAIAGVGERDVLAFVIADPLTAALGLDQVFGSSTKPAAMSGKVTAVRMLPGVGPFSRHRVFLQMFRSALHSAPRHDDDNGDLKRLLAYA